MRIFTFIFFVAFVLCAKLSAAQSGGPPMMTDDPGVVDLHQWEINTSVNPLVTNTAEIAAPYIDANYGVLPRLQLKVESPYVFSIDHGHWTSALGEIEIGVKYNFLDETKSFIAAGTYPQLVVRGEKGFLLPLLLEKTFGKFLVGEDVGYFFGKNNFNNLQWGTLFGWQAAPKLQLMAEYFYQHDYYTAPSDEGYVNVGFRQALSKNFSLMGSFGTQVVTPQGEQTAFFFSWMGIQSDF